MIETKIFLNLCANCSMLKDGTQGTKINVPDKYRVTLNGIEYYPISCIVWYEHGKQIISGKLHDLNSNSTVTALLERIERKIDDV